jgi:acyl carrier protein
MKPLRGVIHAAGVLSDGILANQTWPNNLRRVFAPKVSGSWHLHRLTQDLSLDFFWLFSSTAAILGSAGTRELQRGQSIFRRFGRTSARFGFARGAASIGARGQKAAWPHSATANLTCRRIGLGSVTPEQGLSLLSHMAHAKDLSQVIVFPVDWATFFRNAPQAKQPLFASFAPSTSRNATPENHAPLLAAVRQLPRYEQMDYLITHQVQRHIAHVLGLDPARVTPQQGFFDMGMDSLTAVEIKNKLQSELGSPLPATLIVQISQFGKISGLFI